MNLAFSIKTSHKILKGNNFTIAGVYSLGFSLFQKGTTEWYNIVKPLMLSWYPLIKSFRKADQCRQIQPKTTPAVRRFPN